MNIISDYIKSINQLAEKAKSLNALDSPMSLHMAELAKLSNITFRSDSLTALMPLSKIIIDSSFQKSLINSIKIQDGLNFAISPISKTLQNYDFKKINQSFALPNSTIDAILQLASQQENINKNLLSSLSGINSTSIAFNEVNKIKNLNIAFTSLSTELTKIASISQNWNLVKDFEELTTEAVILSNQLTDEYSSSIKISIAEFKSLLNSVQEFYLKNKDAGIILLFLIDVILRFAGLHQYYDFIKEKPEPATRIEVNEIKDSQTVILESLKEIKQQIIEKNKISYTNKGCQIKLKPNSRSAVINHLPFNYEVVIVKIQPTWLLINYYDPKDGLPQTGWINRNDIK